MHTLATNWGWFLAFAVVLLVTTVLLQVRNMRKIAVEFLNTPSNAMDGAFKRFLPVIICWIGTVLCGILFIVGVIASLMGK